MLLRQAVPGPGVALDRFAERLQARLIEVTDRGPLRKLVVGLSGERWLGHPAHPAVVMVPAGCWLVSAWYDARSAHGGDPDAENVADTTLTLGLIAAVPAALTGIAQFLHTEGQARRIATVHWALNASAVTLYAASWFLRRRGRRTAGRRASAAGLGLVGPGAYLGGHLAYRLGVGQVIDRSSHPAT